MKNLHVLTWLLCCLSAFISAPLWSHDFWLEAHPFYTDNDKQVDVSIHVGNHFVGDSIPNIISWYSDFSLYQEQAITEVEGELGRDPAGYFTPAKNGTYNIGYQSNFTYVEIVPETFNKYLQEEGLDNAIAYREQHQQQKVIGKENYIRHCKLLVQAGDSFEEDASALKLGYELEIMPQQNPYKLMPGDRLDLRVLYRNEPAAGLLLIAFSKAIPEQQQRVRTNDQGEASITLDQPGPWLVKTVKIIRIENNKADWQSHWASLTFAVNKPQ